MKINEPKVSVVMPVYNALPYLDQSIRSIYAQTYKNWELIIVDDASTDGSWEFASRIDDCRVRLFRNDKNMKNSYTLNRAIALASGEYIAKMDADDVSFPERIERQINYLLKHPHVDAVSCGLFRVDNEMNLITFIRPPEFHNDIIRFISLGPKFIFGPSFQFTDGCIVAKKKWYEIWNYDQDIPYAQDFDLNLRSHYTSVFANVSDPLYIYRRVGVTSSWLSQTKAVYYKLISLLRYGFKMSNLGMSFLSLFSLAMRPLFTYLTTIYVMFIRKNARAQTAERQTDLGEDAKRIRQAIEVINKVTIPFATGR